MKIVLAAVLLAPQLALAQAPGQTPAPRGGSAIQEMQRQQARPPGQEPFVPNQRREAADADAASVDDAAGQLRAALVALRAKRGGQANEFLERAEARLLTRSTPAPTAGEPVQGGVVGRIATARRAVQANDGVTAIREIEATLDALDRPRQAPRPSR